MKQSRKSAPLSKANWLVKPLALSSRSFAKRFQSFLSEKKFLTRGTKILVAVSGGPDSMTLLFLLARLAPIYRWKLVIAHVHYHLRGKDSDRDAALVEETAMMLNLPFVIFHSRVKPKANVEEKLRDIRYAFFEKIRAEKRLDTIVTAHTKNDLAETFLLNLLRGSGTFGLSPFSRERASIVRPFILFERQDILHFLSEEKLPFRIDQSNLAKKFTRNKIRQELLPFLQKKFNPNIIATLAHTAELVSQTGQGALPFFLHSAGKNTFTFGKRSFLELSSPDQQSVLAHFFRSVLGHSPSKSFISECLKAIQSEKPKLQKLENRDLKIRVFHDRVETTFKQLSQPN